MSGNSTTVGVEVLQTTRRSCPDRTGQGSVGTPGTDCTGFNPSESLHDRGRCRQTGWSVRNRSEYRTSDADHGTDWTGQVGRDLDKKVFTPFSEDGKRYETFTGSTKVTFSPTGLDRPLDVELCSVGRRWDSAGVSLSPETQWEPEDSEVHGPIQSCLCVSPDRHFPGVLVQG